MTHPNKSRSEIEYIPNPMIENLSIELLETKTYQRRWLNLFLFSLFCIVANLHFLQIIIIQNILCRYYNVSEFVFNWAFIVFSGVYIVLLLPMLYVLNKKGLHFLCTIGAICICLACWVKVLSALYCRFDVLFLGQFLAACGWIVSIIVPPHLAARWFENNRISFATSIGQMSNNIGMIISQTSSLIVKNNDNFDDIGNDLYSLFLGVAIPSTCILIIIIFFFKAEPKIPPSKTRAFQKFYQQKKEPLWKPVIRILKNVNFILLWNSFGLHMMVTGGIFTFLNPFYMAHFKNGEQSIGIIGMSIIISGTIMDIALSILQDKTKEYKKLLLIVSGLAIISEVSFALALHVEIEWLVYITAILTGSFVIGYITIGSQTCVEVTYPEEEGISTAIYTMSHRIFEFIFLPILSKIMESYGEKAVHSCLVGVLIISFFITLVNKDVQRRQKLVNQLDNKTGPACISELELIKTELTP